MNKISFSARSARFSLKDQVHFAKRLSFLINAGVPLVEGLHILRDQIRGGSRGRMIEHVVSDVSSGQSLSRSFAKFPRVFSEFTISMVKIGESSGTLSQSLTYLAEELKKRQILRRKILSAMLYPLFITIATLGITGALTVFIFPKIMPIFISLHAELPLTTRILLGVSTYLQHWGVYTVIGVCVVVALFLFIRSCFEGLRYMSDYVLLKLPIAGRIARMYNLATFARTLGLLLKSGIAVGEAAEITAQTTRNRVYRHAYLRMNESVMKGEQISKSLLRESRLFPDMFSHMISIGEKTGNLSSTLIYLAEMYENEVEEATKGLSSSIEPLLMIVMGLLVGLIAISVITPIYDITQHLQPK
jgi:type IV pilus assembly protein PilC